MKHSHKGLPAPLGIKDRLVFHPQQVRAAGATHVHIQQTYTLTLTCQHLGQQHGHRGLACMVNTKNTVVMCRKIESSVCRTWKHSYCPLFSTSLNNKHETNSSKIYSAKCAYQCLTKIGGIYFMGRWNSSKGQIKWGEFDKQFALSLRMPIVCSVVLLLYLNAGKL